MEVKEIYTWAKHHITFPLSRKMFGATKIVSIIMNELGQSTLGNYVAYGQSNRAIKEVKNTRLNYLNMTDKLFEIAEDAWFRVKDYAKQEMFDDNEDEWDDPDEIGDEEMDHHFNEAYFIDYFQQEVGHNITGKYPDWDTYLSDIDFRKWNNSYQSLEDYINSKYISPLEDEINDICDKYLKAIDHAIHEWNANKHNMVRLAMGIDEYDVDWVDV